MANPIGNLPVNPFDHAFEMLGQTPEVTTENVNAEALELLTEAMTTRASERGRMVLLRSPRAGFGKTHLLMRLHQRVAHTHEFIPLEPTKGRYLDAQSVLDAVLRRFSRVLPAGGGLTVLDLLARRILAASLEPLVKSGEVPSQDRDSALQALQLRPVETFDFHNEDAVTARWAMTNFSLLGPRLTSELAERTHAGYRPVAWWVELLFRYSSAAIDQTSRNSSLFETVFGGDQVETDMHEKLVTLLNLTGLVTSPVLILDEVEGFSSNPEAALQVATFLNALHQSCNKLALIISVNGDVWETAFLPRIPCGLKDRLSDIVVDLKPMDKDTAVALLRDRAGDQAESIADSMDFDSGVVYARGLVREASCAWVGMAATAAASLAEGNDEDLQTPISLVIPDPVEPASETLAVDDPGVELHAPASVVVPAAYTANIEPSAAELHAQVPPVSQELAEVPDPEIPPQFHPTQPVQSVQQPETEQPDQPVRLDPMGELDPAGDFDELMKPDVREEPIFEPQTSFEPDPRPYLPDDLPQPFANHPPQQETGQAETPHFEPQQHPPSRPVNPGVDSPFSIAEDAQPIVPTTPTVEPNQPFGEEPRNVIESPFAIDTGATEVASPFQSVQTAQHSQAVPEPSPHMEPTAGAPPVQDTPSFQSQHQQPATESPFRGEDGKTPSHTVTENDHEKVEDLLKQFRDRYGRE